MLLLRAFYSKFGHMRDKASISTKQNIEKCLWKTDEFLSKYPTYFAYLPTRIMNNCILLPIEAESQDTALRIFSTLNDRGKPLSDADIFKAQFYKHFSKLGKKEEFIAQWKKLEELCERIYTIYVFCPCKNGDCIIYIRSFKKIL